MSISYELEEIRPRMRITMKRRWKQRLRDWLNDGSGEIEQFDKIQVDDSPSLDSDKGIRFNVYKASGGTIIETRFYDRVKDRSHNSLHVIVDGDDIGKAIGKIITMETLKV